MTTTQTRSNRYQRRRLRKRWLRVLIWIVIALGYIALMWYYVFPWADKIVNRPTV